MEGNVIALGICIISIDQASSKLLFFPVRSGSVGGWLRLTSQPLHTRVDHSPRHVSKNVQSPQCPNQIDFISMRQEVGIVGLTHSSGDHLVV